MKKLLFIPAALFPYVILAAVAMIFWGSSILEALFGELAYYLIAANYFVIPAVLVFMLLAVVLTVIACVLALVKGWDARQLARTAMVIKLVQIPAYLAIFVLGLILLITIFTFGFSIAFVFFDGVAIFMTGLLGTAAAVRAYQTRVLTLGQAVVLSILQFVFCADVVASIVLFCLLRKAQDDQTADEISTNSEGAL